VTGETVCFFQAEQGYRVCVAMAETHHALRREMHIGKIIPLTAGSASHVLLAWGQEVLLSSALQSLLDSPDDQTSARVQHLEAAVRRTRRDGFSITIGEREDGACGLAAPVFDPVGALVGAVHINGPTLRMPREVCQGWVEDLLTTAERMTRLNGGRFPDEAPR
jgi:DNA-binding IclR family transcriptional regulator